MRLAVCLTVIMFAVLANCATPGPYETKPRRTIRGFKNVALSTARGFGKRDYDVSGGLYGERPESFPIDWFVEEMQNNPELARIIVHKFIDENQDGELTADELLGRVY